MTNIFFLYLKTLENHFRVLVITINVHESFDFTPATTMDASAYLLSISCMDRALGLIAFSELYLFEMGEENIGQDRHASP